jgi:hypothetical protein
MGFVFIASSSHLVFKFKIIFSLKSLKKRRCLFFRQK